MEKNTQLLCAKIHRFKFLSENQEELHQTLLKLETMQFSQQAANLDWLLNATDVMIGVWFFEFYKIISEHLFTTLSINNLFQLVIFRYEAVNLVTGSMARIEALACITVAQNDTAAVAIVNGIVGPLQAAGLHL